MGRRRTGGPLMADSFRPVFDAIKETTVAFVEASEANARAGRGLEKMLDAAMQAREEHEDLRETVHRLEGLVIQLGTEIRELRDRPSQ
jgi:predicted  nucleic acid-binding Zn-ribbon protein